jgi:hypothetical protein
MSNPPETHVTAVVPVYLGRGETRTYAGSCPTGVGKPVSTPTLDGSLLEGAIEGAEADRTVIGGARHLYDRQDLNFVEPWAGSGFIEHDTAEVRGVLLGAVHLMTFDAEGEANIVFKCRPVTSLMYLSRLGRENFKGRPHAVHHLAGKAERP